MISNILSVVFAAAFFIFVSWRKLQKHKSPKSNGEGERPKSKSVKELERNKYRGFGQIN